MEPINNIQPPEFPPKEESKDTKALKNQYMFFAPLTLAYAIFYTLCMYKNAGGITFPFFVIGSLGYLYLCVTKLGLTLKKSSYFSIISCVLISISTIFTDNRDFWDINELAIFILIMCVILNQFYDTKDWKLGKYFTALFRQCFASFSCIIRPFTDAHDYNETHDKKSSKKFLFVLLGVLIAIPLVIVVLALLSEADAVFRQSMQVILDAIALETAFSVAWKIFYGFIFAYMLLAYSCKHTIEENVKNCRNFEPIIAITITSILSFVYILFSSVQIAYLFIGNLKLPEGYTYAEYAREGFFQLLAVSIINLVIVILCLTLFKESKALKVILTIFSICTYIMIISSALRMIMYIRYYYMTVDRVLVLWALTTLSIIFVGVLISIFKEDFKLFDYIRIVVTICYILLAFSRPDYIVADINLSQAPTPKEANVSSGNFFLADNKYTDFYYINNLSADAAGPITNYISNYDYAYGVYGTDEALVEYHSEDGDYYDGDEYVFNDPDDNPKLFAYYYMDKIYERYDRMSLRKFNFSIYTANKYFE